MQGVDADASQARAALYSEIRGKLTSTRDIGGLDEILGTSLYNSNNPISSSFFFKEFLSGASDAVLRSLRYGTPLAIDPSLTIEQYQAKLDQRESHICVAAINQVGYTADGKNSEMDQLLARIKKNLSGSSSGGRGQREAAPIFAEERKIVGLLRAHMAQAPGADQIRRILGEVHDVELFNNRIRRVVFTHEADKSKKTETLSNSKKVEMQLSMVISMRTGQDEAFVKIQNCVVQYLKAQQVVLGNRMGAIKGGRAKTSQQLFAEAGLANVKPSPTQFESVPKAQREAYQLKYFFEGKSGFATLADEEQFLITRLVKIEDTLAYLQSRLDGALTANRALAQLSKAQMDFLADMMLQLNRDNLPLAGDVQHLRSASQTADASTAEGKAMFEAFVYFRQIARDLSAMSEAMDLEKARNGARREDARELRLLTK